MKQEMFPLLKLMQQETKQTSCIINEASSLDQLIMNIKSLPAPFIADNQVDVSFSFSPN